MAQFHLPGINPLMVPKNIGKNVVSKYLFNYYNIEYSIRYWRYAIDQALNYSNLVPLDSLYSWCVQSSPFLVSMINKRLTPANMTNFAFTRNGVIDEYLTKTITSTKWFKKIIRCIVLSKFYGVQCIAIDINKDEVTEYPLRNLDIINRAIRKMTYSYSNVVNVDDYDNIFMFIPETSQDFKLGMLQPISRAIISINEAYSNWSIVGARFSFPMTTIGFFDQNPEAKQQAVEIAGEMNPMITPVIPFIKGINGENKYQVEVNPVQSQSYPDSFRVFKEFIMEYKSEIMQLILGGTLLGATEKNTNSEQLANIHLEMYKNILEGDTTDILHAFNQGYNNIIYKLGKLLNLDLTNVKLVEIPAKKISVSDMKIITDSLAKQGMCVKPEFYTRIGIDPSEINTNVRQSSWINIVKNKATSLFNFNKK